MKYKIDKHSGYSLASITTTNNPTVTAIISADVHANNTAHTQAVSYMYSDALLSGTANKSRDEFIGAINLLGASVDVSVSGGYLRITLKSRKEQFAKLLTLVSQMLTTPAFSNSEIKRIRSTSVNELEQAKENTRSLAHSSLQNELYAKNDRKYSFSLDDTIAATEEVSGADLKKFHKLILESAWTVSIAADKTEVTKFGALIKKVNRFEGLTTAQADHQQLAPKKKLILHNVSSRTNIDFSIGAPVPFTLHHPDYIPLTLGLNVLAKWGGFSGRLMSTVREKEGLTYGIYGALEGFSGGEQGLWRIMTFFAPDKALQGLTSTFREINKIYQKGITDEELERFKTITNTGQILVKDSIQGALSDLHTYHVHGFSINEMNEHKARINNLTKQEVNSAIKKYLNPQDLVVCGAGPIGTVKKELSKFVKEL